MKIIVSYKDGSSDFVLELPSTAAVADEMAATYAVYAPALAHELHKNIDLLLSGKKIEIVPGEFWQLA